MQQKQQKTLKMSAFSLVSYPPPSPPPPLVVLSQSRVPYRDAGARDFEPALSSLGFSQDRMWCIHLTGYPTVNRVRNIYV